MPKPGASVSWWQVPFLAVVGVVKLGWSLVTRKPWSKEEQ